MKHPVVPGTLPGFLHNLTVLYVSIDIAFGKAPVKTLWMLLIVFPVITGAMPIFCHSYKQYSDLNKERTTQDSSGVLAPMCRCTRSVFSISPSFQS